MSTTAWSLLYVCVFVSSREYRVGRKYGNKKWQLENEFRWDLEHSHIIYVLCLRLTKKPDNLQKPSLGVRPRDIQ
ncbi:hypothetical protein Y032_0334g2850 [Ancylostoma ceylanicum]|uniref:Secreted protein n=1 Tax=Ancylostoma ceylanicum TaxID=53326 RepID=A0A016RZ21_9BILA|nr:hypothetical protein Y032_0334g2850 [Ancylostoma ceylanicum]